MSDEKTLPYPPGGGPAGDPFDAPTVRQPPGQSYPQSPQQPLEPTIRQGAGYPGGMQQASPLYGGSSGQERTVVIGQDQGQIVLAWLVITQGNGRGQIFRLSPEPMVIGRDYGCEIILEDDTVSRQHAKIRMEHQEDDMSFYIQDMASTAGIQVNGEVVIKHQLKDGDRIVLGQIQLVFKQV